MDGINDEFTRTSEFVASYLGDVDGQELAALSDSVFLTRYNREDLIVQQCSLASTVYVVYDGLIRVGRYTRTDKRRALRFLGRGGWFGLESLFMDKEDSNIQYARALTDCELILIERRAFKDFLREHTHALFSLCNWLSQQVASLELKLTRDFSEGAQQNLSCLLIALGGRFGKTIDQGTLIDLELPNPTMANLLGISSETLRRLIKKMVNNGTVQVDGDKIILVNEQSLIKTANIDNYSLETLKNTF